MSKDFTKRLEEFNQAFENLAHTRQSGFNAIVLAKFDDQETAYSAFGDDEPATVTMLFNAFVTKVLELEDPERVPDLILMLIMVLGMDIDDKFIQAINNMAAKAGTKTIQ